MYNILIAKDDKDIANLLKLYFEGDETIVMVHISKIRKKIEDNPQNPVYIKTIRGLGYKIDKIKG